MNISFNRVAVTQPSHTQNYSQSSLLRFPYMRPDSLTFVEVTRGIVRVVRVRPSNVFNFVVQVTLRHRITTSLTRHRVVRRLVRTLTNANRPVISNNGKLSRLARGTNLLIRLTRNNLLQHLTLFSVTLKGTPFRVTITKISHSSNRPTTLIRRRTTNQMFTRRQRLLDIRQHRYNQPITHPSLQRRHEYKGT